MTRRLQLPEMLVVLTIVTVLFFASLFTLPAANWYFDNAATGANNGTNWANAWTNNASVNWSGSGVMPGDMLYVSGGTTTKTYTESISIGKNGTTGNYITVKIGQDAGHNGVAIFEGFGIGMNGNSPQWNWIDGGRSGSFVGPTNHQQVMSGSTAITNNIGFWFRNLVGTEDSLVSPVLWYFRETSNLKFSYIEVSGLTNSAVGTSRGMVCFGSPDPPAPTTNIVFEYLYIHNNYGQVFGWNQNIATGFDEIVFKFGYVYLNEEDHFETGGGWTIRDSVIGPCSGASVHNDFFQFSGNFVKVYNNDVRESQNAIMRIQTQAAGAGTNLRHSIWFFNNLVTEKQGRAPGGGTLTEPFCMVHWNSVSPTHMTIWSNIVFANNLLYNSVLSTVVEPDEMCRNLVMYWTRGNQVTNSIITSNVFANNLMVMKHKGIGFPVSTNLQAAGTHWPHTTNDMWVDYNNFAGTNTALITTPRYLSYMDVGTNAEFHPNKGNNLTNYPQWVDAANDNFELASADIAAKDTGYNLSDYFTFDSLNRSRSGVWDRGPLEYQVLATNLLVLLSFEDDFSDNQLDDSSGNGNHARRFGRVGSTYPTNFPTQVWATNTPGGITNMGKAGRFAWFTNDYGIYGRDGQYAAITNFSAFTNLNQMTVAVWARYYSWQTNAAGCTDYTCDQQGSLLSAGTSTGIVGTWGLGRRDFNTLNKTRFMVMTNQGTFQSHETHYPDPGFPDNESGDTFNWAHYAFTWTNGVYICYFNGTNFSSGNIANVVTNLTMAWNNNVSMPFIGVGCSTHGGSPALEDEPGGPDYPNHGWFNGMMDDVRIYDVALTAAQVQALAISTPVRRTLRVVGNVRANNAIIGSN